MRTHGWSGRVPATDAEAVARILAATREVIDERGAATKLSDVARVLGVTRQTVYRYFPSTEALLAATAAEAVGTYLDGISARFAGIAEPDAAVIAGVCAVLETVTDDPYLGILMSPGHQTLPAIGGITSDGARVFARAMVERMDVDWAARGYGEPELGLVVEFILRTLQSFILDPGGSSSVAGRRELLDAWLGAAIRALPARTAVGR
ncbi:TetR/AcrR family transcriptional regulator [Gordonia sp. NB41Y]|uniref:TetR/AcrR family transcriptional regulator n=1 Tax=Gordonia sp. NB41Y TaxID=875808 RepID=UPI0006B170E2|nr:TetR/AcrR family transcriptional regulator [Gordonia sp. NB41Y]KOY50024.1 TetR family transcriptional regulator [Gordonia sp. NB41Y]WLP93142.1 helix-turn-helix domain-containing protein [Gordonia sp. NB41Y]